MIRFMRPGDAVEVRDVFRRSFPLHLQQFMVYGQPGLDKYLVDILKYPGLFPNFKLYVFDDALGIGYAEFRIDDTKNEGFLSNIFVDARLRGRGAGSQLIRHFLGRHPELTRVSLDVFESNPAAQRLYQRLGFKPESCRHWYVKPLRHLEGQEAPVPVLQQPLPSVAMFERYGFSEFQLVGSGLKFGRIGPGVLRCHHPVDADNEALLLVLQQHFPEVAQAFCITSETLPEPWQKIDTSWRMVLHREGCR
ncbi:GNAT family N-acetyltransferase [Deinococcus sp. MIMF12]|uniref:GNAT family N-acetyltransferase n=1 Tax=Deinococcus rhizophilus TaxID=3049544 RepID=A0ABT7JF90_9DEIO|nr:GNAT family N-acetyltransferase [Deinococcus rhizophilus]MDL2343601.1 GNAT family N-acetyltransferase [Deinococcus rhizophilus]